MSDNEIVKMDLDSFLGIEKKQSTNLPNMPTSDKITVVGIMVDDSGSMADSTRALIDGVNAALDALRGAKSADFYVHIHGFSTTYYNGLLRDLKEPFGKEYYAGHSFSPVVDTAIRYYKLMQETIDYYTSNGIPCTGAYLVMTDALPNGDEHFPEDFKKLIEENPSNIVMGMGIVHGSHNKEQYQHMFANMGISKILTPAASGSEIRNALNEFSRSVVSAAITPY